MKKTIAIDFDGVLSAYTGWKGRDAPLDPPLPGAIDALRAYLNAGYQVVIFTTRATTSNGAMALVKWFMEAGLNRNELETLSITDQKAPAWLYIDDRCWLFSGSFPTVEEIEAFKPWWQKD